MTGKASQKVDQERTMRVGEKECQSGHKGAGGEGSQVEIEQWKHRQLEGDSPQGGVAVEKRLGSSVSPFINVTVLCHYPELRSGLGRFFRHQSGEQL